MADQTLIPWWVDGERVELSPVTLREDADGVRLSGLPRLLCNFCGALWALTEPYGMQTTDGCPACPADELRPEEEAAARGQLLLDRESRIRAIAAWLGSNEAAESLDLWCVDANIWRVDDTWPDRNRRELLAEASAVIAVMPAWEEA